MERSKPARLLSGAALVSGGLAAISGMAFAFGSSFTTLDTGFGNSGVVQVPGYTVTDLGSAKDKGVDLAVGSDDSIYSLGFTTDTGGSVANVITHYSAGSGALDTTLGAGGKLVLSNSTVPFASGAYNAVLLAVDDVNRKIYIAGFVFGATTQLQVARFNFDGTLDTSYGAAGLSDPLPTKGNDIYTGKLVLDSSLHLYFEGADLNANSTFTAITSSNGSFLARYTKAGKLDSTFATTGYLSFKFGACDQTSNNFTIAAGGAIYIPGAVFSSCSATTAVPAVARITPAGQLDSTFGSSGIASFSSLATDSGGDYGFAAQEQGSGKVAFAFGNGPGDHAVMLNSDGSLDSSVTETNATYTIANSSFTQNGGSIIQSTGKLVYSGQYQTSASTTDLGLTRLDGDPAFGQSQSGSGSSSSSSGGSSSSSSSSGSSGGSSSSSSSSSSSGSSSSSSSSSGSSGGHSSSSSSSSGGSSSGSSSGGHSSSSSSSGGQSSSSSSSGGTSSGASTAGGSGGGGAFGLPLLLGLALAGAVRRRRNG